MVSTTAPPEQNPNVRITTFCIRRLCFGYKNQNLVPPPSDGPDYYSASVVFATIVVVMCLLVMLLLVLLETIRLLTRSASPPQVPKTAECMARVYRQVVATCPPTYPTESGTCPVCLDEYHPSTFGRKMPCQHFFHIGCIDRWIMRSAARRCQRDVVRCPVCKQPILHEHVEISMEETPLITDHDRRFSDEMHLAENMV